MRKNGIKKKKEERMLKKNWQVKVGPSIVFEEVVYARNFSEDEEETIQEADEKEEITPEFQEILNQLKAFLPEKWQKTLDSGKFGFALEDGILQIW